MGDLRIWFSLIAVLAVGSLAPSAQAGGLAVPGEVYSTGYLENPAGSLPGGDSGYGTKILRLDPTTGASHAYAGTLCVFIELDEPRVDAITTCATTSDKFHYAICQRRTDRTEIDGPGTAITTLASTDQQTAMSAFPTATAWDQPEPFTVSISGTSLPDGGIAFDDGTVSVALTDVTDANEEIDPPGVCFTIGLSGASADGCVGRSLLATGLAYAAFQDGNGPIEIVGIVPDEVTSIQIEGTTLTPTNNVWHYTTTGSVNPRIAVQTADGRQHRLHPRPRRPSPPRL